MTAQELREKLHHAILDEPSHGNVAAKAGLYVLVNLHRSVEQRVYSIGGDQMTYPTIHAAAEDLLDKMQVFGHDILSMRIFKLEPVSLDTVRKELIQIHKDIRSDTNEHQN